jgi:hypothetical protein
MNNPLYLLLPFAIPSLMSNITIRHDPSQGVPHLFARTVPPPLVEEESVSSISLHTILMRWIVETKIGRE